MQQQKALSDRVQALGLAGVPCNLVLSAGDYQLLLAEAPKVPPEELTDAMRWRIRDLITYSIDEAIVDAAPLPADAGRGGQSMAFVVAMKQARIEPLVDLVNNAGLFLQTIDIEEMALRNLVQRLALEHRSIGIIKLRPGGGLVCMVRDGHLYLARRFDLPYNAGLLDDIPQEALALELQRSLDYFERQMGQTPPSSVYVGGENVSADKLTSVLRQSVAVPVTLLPLEAWFDSSVADENILQLCMSAIGGALREEAADG